ncbi:hypothetical protein Goklo_013487 [Gossypium klotzschianum]|uniref:RNase H type-1 domain-containing protein n=1 Tax=Gossypium klotzschianum TaxID=34286 RepID=A0A7J8U549_9ROSI|nr:hypothetical protein [Gossypium klotzschianum]
MLANSRRNQHNDLTMYFICWQSPPSDWCKLNTNGSRHSITSRAFAGGLLRDHQGKWVIGYSRNIHICPVLDAKLWVIMDGLDIV